MTTQEFFELHRHAFWLPQGREFTTRTGSGPLAPWASCHSLGEDMEPWNRICDTPAVELMPDMPFERSRFRKDGYAMWDLIVGGGASGFRRNIEGRKIRIRQQVPSRSTNTARKRMWELYARNELTLCQNVLQIGDRKAWSERLDRAHAMAHAELDARWRSSALESSLSVGAREFAQAFAELAVAELYNMPVADCRPRHGAGRLPYGIYVSMTTRNSFTAPAMAMFPFDRKLDLVDRVFAVVHVVVEIGADPVAMVMPGAAPSPWEDQWSGQPVRAMVMGWETADWFGAQDVGLRPYTAFAEPHGEMVFYSHPDDLMPMDTFGFYLAAAERDCATPDGRIYRRAELAGRETRSRSPLLPCHMCLLANRDVTEQSGRPDYRIPPGWKNHPEWVAYFDKTRKIIRCAARSSMVYEPALRKLRASRSRSRAEYMRQLKKQEIRKYGSLPKRHT